MTDTTERSGFVYMHKLLKQLLILLLCTVLIGTGFAPASVSAASRPVTISSCKISGKSKVRVTLSRQIHVKYPDLAVTFLH